MPSTSPLSAKRNRGKRVRSSRDRVREDHNTHGHAPKWSRYSAFVKVSERRISDQSKIGTSFVWCIFYTGENEICDEPFQNEFIDNFVPYATFLPALNDSCHLTGIPMSTRLRKRQVKTPPPPTTTQSSKLTRPETHTHTHTHKHTHTHCMEPHTSLAAAGDAVVLVAHVSAVVDTVALPAVLHADPVAALLLLRTTCQAE